MNKMEKIEEKDYCTLGIENRCPHLDYCLDTNSFSLEVLQINPLEKNYIKIGFEDKEKPKVMNENIEKKIKKSRTWKPVGIEGITFACTEIRKESRNNTYTSGVRD
jgi:hypothetical protein